MSSNIVQQPEFGFKIALVGDGGVGKTTYRQRLCAGEFERGYVPTLGVDVRTVTFQSNYGEIKFSCWDTAGQEKFGGLRDGYYIGSHGAIAMFDLTSHTSYINVPKWINSVTSTVPGIPVVVCGNKVDCQDTAVTIEERAAWERRYGNYCDLSVKSNYNFEKPFLDLARSLTGHDNLVFT
jgi:GTP-binding nuclear protein Ran